MRSLKQFLVIILILAAVIAIIDRWPSASPESTASMARAVTRIVDGDSLYLQGIKPQIRLFGVDAPERDEAGYRAATDTLRRLVESQRLRCDQVDQDRYERIIGRCFLVNGQEVNRIMIESGTAKEYCRFSKRPLWTLLRPFLRVAEAHFALSRIRPPGVLPSTRFAGPSLALRSFR